ncbi:MAG: glycosyltransferase family 4 protein [Cyclobacteriaceae bacterium]
MKIAFVTNTCWNVFNFREGLVKYFLNQGDEVVSLAPSDAYTKEIEKWGVRHIETPLDQTGTNPITDLRYLKALRRILKSELPDVALCFTIKPNIYASLAGKLTGVPTICNVSGLGTVFLVSGWLGRFALNLYKFAFAYSTFIFFQNSDDRKLFLTHVKLKRNKVGLLPGSGINLQRFGYKEPLISTPTTALMVGRVIEEKGVRDFVEAARILKNARAAVEFTLVGKIDEGHARSISKVEVDDWVAEGLIKYLPHYDGIQDLIAKHELVVLPSFREGTPRTLLEGAALGKALLASNVPGCKEVVVDGINGFLFEVQNPKSLADKVKLYQSLSSHEKAQLGVNSRKLVEDKFDENYIIRAYKETIAQIVDK